MDRREAITKFIALYSGYFQLDPFPEQVFRKAKHEFFLQQAGMPPPKNTEIAGSVLTSMIKSSQIQTEEELEGIWKFPFFARNIQNKTYYEELLETRKKQPGRLVDVDELKKGEMREEILERYKTEAEEKVRLEKSEEIKQLEEEAKRIREEFPSVLDSAEYPLPEEETAEPIPEDIDFKWWQKLSLTENPLPDTQGIESFSRELYDQIVHKTSIFTRYIQLAELTPQELFKNTLVYGWFGSGKSTFFDYFYSKLASRNIDAIRIRPAPPFDVELLYQDFMRQTYSQLITIYRSYSEEGVSEFGALERIEGIEKIMRILSTKYGVLGFIVFIEDLHKGELKVASQFLSYLQTLTSRIKTDTGIRRIGFFIEASYDWHQMIMNNSKYSGSIEWEEPMPAVDVEWALDAVNRRLRAFAKNKENPKQVTRNFIEHVYREIEHNRAPEFLTIRELLREVRKEFEQGHFDALSANPVKVSKATLDEIKSHIERDLRVRNPLYRLIYGRKNLTAAQKTHCLELLIRIYLEGNIPESELVIDKPKRSYLWQMANVGLIGRTYENGQLVWKISKDVWDFNNFIIRRYHLSLEDYLLKIYGETAEAKSRRRPRNTDIEFIDSLLATIKRDAFYQQLEETKEYHVVTLEMEEVYPSLQNGATDMIRKCMQSLASLTRAYQIFEGLKVSANDAETIAFWIPFWYSPEVVVRFLRTRNMAEGENKSEELAPRIVALYDDAFSEIISFFRSEYEGAKQLRIPVSALTNDEIKLFHECRSLFSDVLRESRYEDIAGRIARLTEQKLRALLFNTFTMLYGERQERLKRIDSKIASRIENRFLDDERNGRGIPVNEFEQLNRTDYNNIITGVRGSPQGRLNWINVFSAILAGWSEEQTSNYLETLENIDKIGVHFKGSAITVEQEGYLYDFIKRTIDFTTKVNRAYPKFLSPSYYQFDSQGRAYFSLVEFKDKNTLAAIKIDSEEAKRLLERFTDRPLIEIDLEDQKDAETLFLMKYRSLCALLAKVSLESREGSSLRFEIVSDRCPEIRCRLTRLADSQQV